MPPIATALDGERPATVKERLRQSLEAGRATQLKDPAVRAFIARMQTPRPFGARRVSVLDLVDDGQSLARDLSEIARLPPSERSEALAKVVRPSLHVVDADARCHESGFPLIEVWRYFRHTWSLEYRPTPGRGLLYLIRNEARPNSPIMAIRSFGERHPPDACSGRSRWLVVSGSPRAHRPRPHLLAKASRFDAPNPAGCPALDPFG